MKLLLILGLSFSCLFAYIDSGTASMALQALVAGVAAAGYTMKIYWFKIKSFFNSEKEDDGNAQK
ncbi:hypothetical protein [Sulfuricurvum sp.]|uniref:hypothetical protein n=1 Tax=Sulfuricurvum sp. TaxID=2025608 RepID=UPI003BB5256B